MNILDIIDNADPFVVVFILGVISVLWLAYSLIQLSRCRESLQDAELEISELLLIMADSDAELASVTKERDELAKKLSSLNTMKVIDFASMRKAGFIA